MLKENNLLNEVAPDFAPDTSPESRPHKRQKAIPTTLIGLKTIPVDGNDVDTSTRSPIPAPSDEFESDSDANLSDYLSSQPLRAVWSGRDHRKPYWYDADWERENTYVPLSQVKNKHDSELMLYRPMRPWSWLEKELDTFIAREAYNKEARAMRSTPVVVSIAPSSEKGSKARQGLSSMAAAALQRRKMDDDSQSQHRPPQSTLLKNPFRRKPAAPSPQDDRNVVTQHAPGLKPISSLQVPEFTRALLQQRKAKETRAQDSLDGKKTPVLQHHEPSGLRVAAAGPLTRSPFAPPSEAETTVESLPEIHRAKNPKQDTPQVSKVVPTTSRLISSTTAETGGTTKPKKRSGKKDEKSQSAGFDWAAWASKRR